MNVILYKENDVEIDLDFIVEKLNHFVKNIRFLTDKTKIVFPNVQLSERENIPFEIKDIDTHSNLIILASNKQFQDNYFFHEIDNNIILLSFYEWKELTKFSKNTGLVYFIADILSLEIDGTERHHDDDITECIYNFTWNKNEIDHGIQSAVICEECQQRIINIEDKQKQLFLDDIMVILEEVKKSTQYDDITKYWKDNNKEKVKIFFSYAHEDRYYLDEFKNYIKIFERNGLVERWDDNELIVGEKWDNTIKDKIYSADIIIFLLSASSLASDYIYNNELKIAFELNEIDEAYVIPIIVKDCLWDMTEFKDFQILPIDGKAVNSWNLREEAWTSTARGLKKAIDNIILAKQQSLERIQDGENSSKIGKILESVKQSDSDKEIVLKFLKTYHRWWFNIPRIINWGSERDGFKRLKTLTNEQLKTILNELEQENKIISKPSSKNKNSLLYKAQ